MTKRVLVLAPHPDDEVLGPGGTLAKLAGSGAVVHVVIVTKAGPPIFSQEVLETGRREAAKAHRVLGVEGTHFLSFPAAGLDTVANAAMNAALLEVFTEVRPELVFVPFLGDIHGDHQQVFASALVCCRPGTALTPSSVYAYETLSETNWNAPYLTPGFLPNVFVDISEQLETKLEAMRQYGSQLKDFPHERSLEAIRALASLRGSTVGRRAAEAFVLVRDIW